MGPFGFSKTFQTHFGVLVFGVLGFWGFGGFLEGKNDGGLRTW